MQGIRLPSTTDRVEVSVVMPCLNERETLARCIRKARACLERLGVAAEIVVADNGSTDGSQRIAHDEGARVVDVAVRGYGAALYQGCVEARGRFIIMGDADDSYDFSRLDAFVEQLRGGADLVMGNRFRGGITPGAMPWKNRYLGNPILSALGRLFFHSAASDFHCGLRGFSREAFDRMNLQTVGMEFASEMVIKATLLGLAVTEVPTTLDKDGRSRAPHLRPWRDGWRHLRFMLLYCPRWLFLYPGLALMLTGAFFGSRAFVQWFMNSGAETAHADTLLFACAAVLLGFQGVAFAFCARIYALNEGLLPEDPTLENMFRYFTLETGLVAGALLVIAGLGGSAYAAVGHASLLAAIPSAAALCLGGQIVFISFLLSFLGLRRRSHPGQPLD